jgi:heme-degrading monooxygenase HmoA
MLHVLIRLTVVDMPTFLKEYATITNVQYRAHGWRHSQVFQVVDSEKEVMLMLVWDDRAAFEGFLKDPTVWQTLSGIQAPKVTFLKMLGEFSS